MSAILRLAYGVCLLVIAAEVSLLAEEDAPKVQWQTDTPLAAKLAVEQGKPILVRFGADWCTYCKKMDHYAFNDDDICAKINEHFIPLYVDADLHPGMLAKMQVKSLPSFVVLSPLMNVVDRASGYKKEKEFLAFIDPHCKLREIAMQRINNAAPAVEQVQAHRFEIKNIPPLDKSLPQVNLQPSATAFAPPVQQKPVLEPFPTMGITQVKPQQNIVTAQADPFPTAQVFAPPAYDNHLNEFNPMQRSLPVQTENKVVVDPKAKVSIPTMPPPLQLANPAIPQVAEAAWPPKDEAAFPQQQPMLNDAPKWGQKVDNSHVFKPDSIDALPPVSVTAVPKLTDNKSPFELPALPDMQVNNAVVPVRETPATPWATEAKSTATEEPLNKTPAHNVSSGNSQLQLNPVSTKPASIVEQSKPVAFSGICLVSILEDGQLIKGDDKYQTTYQGFRLNFTSQKYQDLFLSNPVRYWPANNGVCPVSAMNKQQALLGQPVFAVRYQGKTHFCADREAAVEFLEDPKRYHAFISK